MHFQLKGHKALQQTFKTLLEGLCNQKTPTKKIYQIVIPKSLKTLTKQDLHEFSVFSLLKLNNTRKHI